MPSSVRPERDTRQKRAIRNVFERSIGPLSPEQLHAAASQESEGLGLATVYRSIRTLLDEGWLDSIEVPGHGAFYERANKEHHHHFACDECGTVYDLDGCSSEVRGRLPRGYRARGHDVTIFGTCAACSTRRPAAGPRKRA